MPPLSSLLLTRVKAFNNRCGVYEISTAQNTQDVWVQIIQLHRTQRHLEWSLISEAGEGKH